MNAYDSHRGQAASHQELLDKTAGCARRSQLLCLLWRITGWRSLALMGSGPAGCNLFVLSSGSLVLGPEMGSFTDCEDLGVEVTRCKPTGFGASECFADFFVFSSGSLVRAL